MLCNFAILLSVCVASHGWLSLNLATYYNICFQPYGCFSNKAPFNNVVLNRPDSPKKQDIQFWLYTQRNREKQIIQPVPQNAHSVQNSNFIAGAKTILLIHGYTDGGDNDWIQNMKDELLKLDEILNVVIVHWKKGATHNYFKCVVNTRVVGAVVARLIQDLNKLKDVPFSAFHVIGHSLGAHISGYVGERINGLGRITGLDPASFGFSSYSKLVKLDSSDALFVDVIHTNDGSLNELAFGYLPGLQVGDADFYVNGGKKQPGCDKTGSIVSIIACSHLRATTYFTNSINKCTYKVHTCPSGPVITNAVMGYYASDNLSGKYCLETASTEPFCEKAVRKRNYQRYVSVLF